MINARLRANIKAQRALSEMLHSNWFAIRNHMHDPVFAELSDMGYVIKGQILDTKVWILTQPGLHAARQSERELS